MKVLKQSLIRFSGVFAAVALFLGVRSMMVACLIWYNQPKVPEALKNYQHKN